MAVTASPRSRRSRAREHHSQRHASRGWRRCGCRTTALPTPSQRNDEPDASLADEVRLWFGVQPELSIWLRHWYPGLPLLWLYERFLGTPADTLSPALRQRLEAARKAEQERLGALHRGTLVPSPPSMLTPAAATPGSTGPSPSQAPGTGYPPPPVRQ